MIRLKNTIFLFLLPVLLITLNSCEDDKEETNFRIIKTNLDETPIFVKGTIELSTSDFEFMVTHDWCKVIKDGSTLTVSAEENYDFLNRSTEIIVTSGDKEYRIPVTQSGILFEFAYDKYEYLTYSLSGGEREIRILSNVDYELIIADEDKDWVTINKRENGYYDIIVAKNSARKRSSITFKYLNKELIVDINQYDYLAYNEVLGSAKMFYTNLENERVEIDVELIEKIKYEELYIKGKFNEMELLIPLKYIEDKEGELQLHASILNDNFQSEVDERIKALSSILKIHRVLNANGNVSYINGGVGRGGYYPASFSIDDNKVVYRFKHTSDGYSDTSAYKRTVLGITIAGTNNIGTLLYGDPYDALYDIEIHKELTN